ncbi:MAG TPA: hypothetical protein DEA44_01370 [Firmicutes bacterium]|nr:hypothetical protein [Bacillota bacterium]
MRIRLLCIGKIKEKYLQAGITEDVKRLGHFAKLEISELDEERMPENPSAAEKAQALKREGERLLKQVHLWGRGWWHHFNTADFPYPLTFPSTLLKIDA